MDKILMLCSLLLLLLGCSSSMPDTSKVEIGKCYRYNVYRKWHHCGKIKILDIDTSFPKQDRAFFLMECYNTMDIKQIIGVAYNNNYIVHFRKIECGGE